MITNFKDCTGCRTCEQKCGRNAIAMQKNAEGFLYPNINESLCNKCGLCEKICPMFRDDLLNDVLEVFAAKSLNKEQMLKSASGGIFPVLAESILEQNGVVFGCAFDENLVAKHIAIENSGELHKLQSSKYVQSDTLNTFAQAKNFLEQNRKVLYSGTPCQIAGLKAFLGKDYEDLITVDLICHGVPSPELFAKYIGWLSKKMKGKIIEYNLRSKDRGGWGYELKTKTKTKTKYMNWRLDPYLSAFLKNETLRECCYSCKYACGRRRVGDITIGDYWGIERMHPEFYSNDGVSAICVNTLGGKSLWKSVGNKMEHIQSSFEKASTVCKMLMRPAKRSIARDTIYDMDKSFFKVSLTALIVTQLKIRLRKFIPSKMRAIKRRLFK